MTYRVLSLFAGIGGFDLGLERTGGFKTVAFCEIDPFCQRVLAKHWPGVPIYDDVRELTAERLAKDGVVPDCIVGGFPCQDISIAWNGPGIAGERSGLWSEYLRLIRELRPSYVVVENVSALLSRGLGRVLGDLAEVRYDAEWQCIPASAVGAPHERDRFWLVAYPDVRQRQRQELSICSRRNATGRGSEALADANRQRRHEMEQPEHGGQARKGPILTPVYASLTRGRRWWETEPDVGRVAHGVPARVDRLRSLGNAVVPQIPELIGRAILAADQARQEAA